MLVLGFRRGNLEFKVKNCTRIFISGIDIHNGWHLTSGEKFLNKKQKCERIFDYDHNGEKQN